MNCLCQAGASGCSAAKAQAGDSNRTLAIDRAAPQPCPAPTMRLPWQCRCRPLPWLLRRLHQHSQQVVAAIWSPEVMAVPRWVRRMCCMWAPPPLAAARRVPHAAPLLASLTWPEARCQRWQPTQFLPPGSNCTRAARAWPAGAGSPRRRRRAHHAHHRILGQRQDHAGQLYPHSQARLPLRRAAQRDCRLGRHRAGPGERARGGFAGQCGCWKGDVPGDGSRRQGRRCSSGGLGLWAPGPGYPAACKQQQNCKSVRLQPFPSTADLAAPPRLHRPRRRRLPRRAPRPRRWLSGRSLRTAASAAAPRTTW